MKYLGVVVFLLLATVAAAQTEPVVEITGKITKVQTTRGQGMPYVDVEADGTSHRVYLGSMRYLVEHDFNPKAGEVIKVTGFRRPGNEVVARSVYLKEQDKELVLRSADGTPLWQRARYGRGRRQASEPEEGKQP